MTTVHKSTHRFSGDVIIDGDLTTASAPNPGDPFAMGSATCSGTLDVVGDTTVSAGSLAVDAGDVTVALGDVDITAGGLTVGGTITATGKTTLTTLALEVPVYADQSAATGGGLVEGDIYQTATGEIRIVTA